MPINIPDTAEEIIQRAKTDVSRAWIGSNPFLKNSSIAATIIGYGLRIFDFYLQLKEAIVQNMPDTATGDPLRRWANIWGKKNLAATKATGNIVVTSKEFSGGTVPLAALLSTTDGVVYETTAEVSVSLHVRTSTNITLTRVGQTVTVTDTFPHDIASNVIADVSGVDQAEYNGEFPITIVDKFAYTYEILGSPVTPATGNFVINTIYALVPVISQEFQDSENGVNVNQILDTPLSFQSTPTFIDTITHVNVEQISGGTDLENDPSLKVRMLTRIQNPIANFNKASIIDQARTVNGVTRVFVEEVTPLVGQVTIYFMRDNDDDPIPSAGQVTIVKDTILLIKPATTIDEDVIVAAPVAVPATINITQLDPDTPDMRTAITKNLAQLFSEEPIVGVDVFSEQYTAAIQNTIDSTGATINSFTGPSGDIVVTEGEIATLGTVNYP